MEALYSYRKYPVLGIVRGTKANCCTEISFYLEKSKSILVFLGARQEITKAIICAIGTNYV